MDLIYWKIGMLPQKALLGSLKTIVDSRTRML